MNKCWYKSPKLIYDAENRRGSQCIRLAPKLENGDIVTLLRESVQRAMPLGESKGIKLSFFSNQRQKIIVTDRKILAKIVWHLLSDAIAFTAVNGKIEVILKGQGDSIRLIVRNHGSWMPPAAAQRIFKPCGREEGRRSLAENRIGLTMAQESVKLLGGDLYMIVGFQGVEVIVDLPGSAAQGSPGMIRLTCDFGRQNLAA